MSFIDFAKKEIFNLIQRDFAFPLDERFKVVAEVEKYKVGEDESVWSQSKGRSPHEFEAYFDGEFVCFFSQRESTTQIRLKILTGLRDLYKQDKIVFNPNIKKIREEEERLRQAKESVVEYSGITSPEEKILLDVVKRQHKKRGKRVIVK